MNIDLDGLEPSQAIIDDPNQSRQYHTYDNGEEITHVGGYWIHEQEGEDGTEYSYFNGNNWQSYTPQQSTTSEDMRFLGNLAARGICENGAEASVNILTICSGGMVGGALKGFGAAFSLNFGVQYTTHVTSIAMRENRLAPVDALGRVDVLDAALQSVNKGGWLTTTILPSTLDFNANLTWGVTGVNKSYTHTGIDLLFNGVTHRLTPNNAKIEMQNADAIVNQGIINHVNALKYARSFEGSPMYKNAYNFYLNTAPKAAVQRPLFDYSKEPGFQFLLNGNGGFGTILKDLTE